MRTRPPPGTARPWHRFYAEGVPLRATVPDAPLTSLLDDSAARSPHRTALVFFGRRTRYRALRRAVDRFAAGLHGLGVRRGDRVALVLPNCPQFVVAFYGTLRLGAVAVPVNPLYTESELRHRIADSGSVAAVVYEGACAAVQAVRPDTSLRHLISTSLADELPLRLRFFLRLPLERARRLRERLAPGLPDGARTVPYRELFARRPARRTPFPPVRPGRTAVLQYTGGTTGTPKGAVLSHRSLLANAHQLRGWCPQIREDRETAVGVLPMFHIYGLTLGLNVCLLAGARIVLLPVFDTQLLLRAARRWRPTLMPGVPPLYDQLLDRPAEELEALGSLRDCLSGAMRLPPETVDRFRAATGGALVEGYGLTEAAPVVLANPLNSNARPGTVGIPLPGTDVRIVDEHDAAHVLECGEAGELAVRGPQVFDGYWRDEEDSARVLRDGWLLTGDIGVMSPDGYVTVFDRKRDVVNVSGFSVFPSEVEDVLTAHPAVAEAAVVAAPDEHRGETVKACVVVREGASLTVPALVEHCARHLTRYKVPGIVEFRASPLPRNQLGKVLRRALRET